MPKRRPNILFIITDQQYAGAMSCAGNPDVYTPIWTASPQRGCDSPAPIARIRYAAPNAPVS